MIKLNFGQNAFCMPSAVIARLKEAETVELRVLLALAADPSLDGEQTRLASVCACSVEEARTALNAWIERGILSRAPSEESMPAMTASVEEAPSTKKSPSRKKLRRADELPNYTTEELTALIEKRESVRALIDEAQRVMEKMFNPSEVNILIGILDYLAISEEALLLLLSYCKRMGKTTMRSVERMAYMLSDKGITEGPAMEEELGAMEAMYSFEGKVRTLFGIKSRTLLSRESKMLRAWADYGYADLDIVTRAYELTVNATGEASLPYANSILERWHSEGLATLEEIDRSIAADREKREGKRKGERTLGNSFNTDDFFEAALKRSFSDESNN